MEDQKSGYNVAKLDPWKFSSYGRARIFWRPPIAWGRNVSSMKFPQYKSNYLKLNPTMWWCVRATMHALIIPYDSLALPCHGSRSL